MKYIFLSIVFMILCSCKTRPVEQSQLAGNPNKKRLQKSQPLNVDVLEEFILNSKLPADSCKIALIEISKTENSATLVFFDQKKQYRRDFTVKNISISKIKMIPGFDDDKEYGLMTIDNTTFLDAALGHNQEKTMKLYINMESKAVAGLSVKFPVSDVKAKSQTCGYKPEVLK